MTIITIAVSLMLVVAGVTLLIVRPDRAVLAYALVNVLAVLLMTFLGAYSAALAQLAAGIPMALLLLRLAEAEKS